MSYSCVQANKLLLLSPVARLSPREWNSGTSEMLLWSTAALLRPSVGQPRFHVLISVWMAKPRRRRFVRGIKVQDAAENGTSCPCPYVETFAEILFPLDSTNLSCATEVKITGTSVSPCGMERVCFYKVSACLTHFVHFKAHHPMEEEEKEERRQIGYWYSLSDRIGVSGF